jgi:hypothetical protein
VEENKLKGKKILLVAPIFYNYHELIIKKLEENGAQVYFIPERKYNILFTVINNFFKWYLPTFQTNHYLSSYSSQNKQSYDYFFVIRGYQMPIAFVDLVKTVNPKIKTILYQWDSEQNNPYFHLVDRFDVSNSFDYDDCEQNANLNYVPLFFTDDIAYEINRNNPITNDLFLFGVYMPERYDVAKKIKSYCNQNNIKIDIYLYISKRTCIKELLLGKKLDYSILNTKFMDRTTYIKKLTQSNIIVDISSSSQSGLAMRIIESLALNKKILTTNKRLLNDNFFDSFQVNYLNTENINITEDFRKRKIEHNDHQMLSLSNWIAKNFENV